MQIFLISSIIQTSSLFFIQIFISSIFLMFCIIIFFNSYLPHQFHFLQHHVLGKYSSAPFFFSRQYHLFKSFSSVQFFFPHIITFFSSNLPHHFHFFFIQCHSFQIFLIRSIFLLCKSSSSIPSFFLTPKITYKS